MKEQSSAVRFLLFILSAAAAAMLCVAMIALAGSETVNGLLSGFGARNALDGVELTDDGGDELEERFAALPDTVSVFRAAAEEGNPLRLFSTTEAQTAETDAYANEEMYAFIRAHALSDGITVQDCAKKYADAYISYARDKGYVTFLSTAIENGLAQMKKSQLVKYMGGESEYAFSTVKAGGVSMTAAIAGGDAETVQQYIDSRFERALYRQLYSRYADGFTDYLNGSESALVMLSDTEKLTALRAVMSDILSGFGYSAGEIEDSPLDSYCQAYSAESFDRSAQDSLPGYDELLSGVSADKDITALVRSARSSAFRTTLAVLAAALVLLLALLRFSDLRRSVTGVRRATRWMPWASLSALVSGGYLALRAALVAKLGVTDDTGLGGSMINALARAAADGLNGWIKGLLFAGLGLFIVWFVFAAFSKKKKTA